MILLSCLNTLITNHDQIYDSLSILKELYIEKMICTTSQSKYVLKQVILLPIVGRKFHSVHNVLFYFMLSCLLYLILNRKRIKTT